MSLGVGEIASNTVDMPGDTLGGIDSAIVWDPKSDRLIALPDRGAGDGTIPFEPRFHFLAVSKSPSDPRLLELSVAKDRRPD